MYFQEGSKTYRMNKTVCCFLILLFIFFFSARLGKSQTSRTDSLESLLHRYTAEDTIRVNLLNEIASDLRYYDYEKSLYYCEKAIELADKLDFKKGKAESFNTIGVNYYMKGKDSLSFKYYTKSLKLHEELGNKIGISISYNNMGVIYSNWGNYSMSIESYKKAIKINEEIGQEANAAKALNNIGVIYYELEDYDKALEYYEKNIKLNEENIIPGKDLDQKRSICNTLNNIALIYEKQNKLDKALEYYDRSEKIAGETNYSYIFGWVYNGKGIVYEKLQNFEKAHEFYLKGLKNREINNDLNGISQSCNNIGNLYLQNGQFQESKDYLLRAFKIAKEIDSPQNQRDATKGLAIVYEQSGNYQTSLKYHKIFKQMSDSLINEGNIKKLAGYEIEQQYEKEKQAIELEQQKKDAIQTEKNKRQTVVTRSSIVGFVLMTLIVFLILRSYIQKQKSNKRLSLQNRKIEYKNQQLHEQNEEIQQLNEELGVSNETLFVQNEELEDHRNNLEKLVKERTADLEIAKEKAEESDRLKSAFLANMSHEIRTPMNAIVGFSSLLNDKELTDETKEELTSQINHNSDTLLKLIDDIIDIAKIESEQLKISKRQCSVNEIFDNLIPIYDKKLTDLIKEHIVFLIKTPESSIPVFTDPLRLQQVFVNLINNAIKFTEQGNIEIGVDKLINKTDITFYVKDTGIGLTDKQKDFIFERFTKIEEDKRKLYRGAGLGLAICKNLIELLSGKIWVESEENVGSTFYFSIPLS